MNSISPLMPGFFLMDVAAFDCPYRFDTAQGRLCRSEGSKALAVSKEPFDDGVIAFDPIVPPRSVYMSDTVEMRVITMIDFADDAPIAKGLVHCPTVHCASNVTKGGADRDRAMQPDPLDRLVE